MRRILVAVVIPALLSPAAVGTVGCGHDTEAGAVQITRSSGPDREVAAGDRAAARGKKAARRVRLR